jgi:thiol-disulfide isomerase/thioredoxin
MLLIILVFLVLILIVSCQSGGPTATPSKLPTETVPAQRPVLTTPAPTTVPQSQPEVQPSETRGSENAYPPPGGTTVTPTTGTVRFTSSPEGAYPGPDSESESQLTTTDEPYPPPGDEGELGDLFSEETEPFSTEEQVDGELDEEGTPTATLTPGVVRTGLIATDPEDFSIVSGEVQLVEFFAYWSPLCVSMAPMMNSLEDKYQDQINFVYLDIDDPANSLFKTLLADRLPPVFYLLDGEGTILAELKGQVTVEEFEALFASVLGLP